MTKNLNCPFCGCGVKESRNGEFIVHPLNDCILENSIWVKNKWNTRPDPLHERFKSYLEGRLNRYHIQKGIERMDKIRPIDENDNAKYIEAKCIYNELNRIFGVDENGN
jgi:hypothetical protein